MDLRLSLAIITGKLIALVINLIGKSGATAAPGLYALKVDPDLVKKLSSKIKNGSIIISGTNGKTTTARIVSSILLTEFKIIHNRQGSNLLRGIASTLISKTSFSGNIKKDLAIWEIDEATVSEAVNHVSPRIILLLNLFRDQLDRYGEVDSIRSRWAKTISALDKKTTLILNADDPGISFLTKFHKGKTIFFGVNQKELNLPKISNVADIKHCLNCHSKLSYTNLLTAHMGHYSCQKCGLVRPEPNIAVQFLEFKPNFTTRARISILNSRSTINYNLPGLYNAYNILGAISVAIALKIELKKIKVGAENFSAVFGRFQKIKIGKKQVLIFLIKNPAGANEVLRTLAQKQKLNILAILNDNIADGRDVSWIWDTDWEILTGKIKQVATSGIRAWDLATRLKYAGMKLSNKDVNKDINYSLNNSLKNLSTKDTLLILPTYTALLDVQKSLNKKGALVKWQDQ